MRYEGVIFDFDGVIVDSEPWWDEADRRIMAAMGAVLLPEAKRMVIGLRQSESIRMLMKIHGIEGDAVELMKRREGVMEEFYSREISLNAGAEEVIKSLHERRVKMAIASSTPSRLVETCLERFKLKKYFMNISSADDVKHGKPAPDIFLAALWALRILVEKVVVVEDSLPGLVGAKAAGLTAVWYRNLHQAAAEKEADVIINSLKELLSLK